MTDTQYHVCHRCGGADKYVVPLFCGELEHRHWNDCIRTLKRQRDELQKGLAATRELLKTVTDAWLDGQQLWPDSPLYAPYKWAALSEDWYREARKALDGKDGGA